MRHFFRTHLPPAEVMQSADAFFAELGLATLASAPRSRTFQGIVGTPEATARMTLSARPEGGHYTFVEAETDQIGESRLDRNVKKFFLQLHRREEPRHVLEGSY